MNRLINREQKAILGVLLNGSDKDAVVSGRWSVLVFSQSNYAFNGDEKINLESSRVIEN